MTVTLIQQGRIIDPASSIDEINDLMIIDGKIAHIGNIPQHIKPDKVISAKNHWVIPGIIDLYTQFNVLSELQPLAEHAAKYGITTLCLSPNAQSIIDNAKIAKAVIQACQPHVRCLPYMALTRQLAGEQLVDAVDLQHAGCIGLHNAGISLQDTQLLRHCFEYAATFDLPIFITPRDGFLSKYGVMHEGAISARLGLTGIPTIAETIDIYRCLELAAYTGARLHFSRISTAKSIDLIKQAKQSGLAITADVSIQQLYLTDMDVSEFESVYRLAVPLRDLSDQNALREALAQGTIDAICSDHHCLTMDDKRCPFSEALMGMLSHASLLPLTLRLVEQKVLTPMRAISQLTQGPARIIGKDLGQLKIGANADICVIDPKAIHYINDQPGYNVYTSAFVNWEFTGKVVETLS